jgi:mevalonate kinase
MAFMIATCAKDSSKNLYLHENRLGWTFHEEDAFQTKSWPEIERIYKNFTDELHEYDSKGKPISEVLKSGFPTSNGTLVIVERTIKRVCARAVTLR